MGSMRSPSTLARTCRREVLRALGGTATLAALVLAPGTGRAPPARAAQPPTTGSVRVGDFAPEFTLKTFAGGSLKLADHLGKRPVLLVFWSFFCFPCQKEMPEIEEFARQLGPDSLTVIGICLDGPAYEERLLPFVRDKGITYPMVYDKETEEYFETAERYGVVGTPTLFLIDPQRRIRLIHLGRLDRDMLAGAVKAAREQSFCSEITKPPTRAPK